MNNPINMIKMMMGKMSPKQMITSMLKDNTNPVMNSLLDMVEKGDDRGIETFARNIMKTQGRDFDKEFSDFMSNFK